MNRTDRPHPIAHRQRRLLAALSALRRVARGALRLAGAALALGVSVAVAEPPAPSISATTPSSTPPPNFVIVLADDMGWGDLDSQGSPGGVTPALDAMAATGTRFTECYATPVCSPSRACLLTGQYPWRTGMTRVLFPADRGGLSTATQTLAEALTPRGYTCGLIGKWHLGHQPPYLPTRRGFAYYFGLPYSNDMGSPQIPLPLMRGERVIETEPDQHYLTQRYTRDAQAFIRAHAREPFFLLLAHAMPHLPLAVSPEFAGRSGHGLYWDAIAEIDWSTGEVLKTLREAGLSTRTLVLFTSDNGPRQNNGESGRTGGLRGWKQDSFEGGVRVPLIATWPGHVPAGQVVQGPVGLIDVMPTLLALADGGASAPARPAGAGPFDGRDCSRWWLGQTGARGPRSEFDYWGRGRLQAIRRGNWKYWLPGSEAGPAGALYHLHDDPAERADQTATERSLRAEFQRQAEESLATAGATRPAMSLP